jgi:methyltransferase family protein
MTVRHPVYASSHPGVRARLASLAADRARERRHELFLELLHPSPSHKIVDLGSGPLGLRAWAPDLDVTGVDVRPQPQYPGPFVRADATQRLPFASHQFDYAFSNSLIEHIPRGSRRWFAAEVRRVARGWWIQTPAYGFPLEPHALLPGAHWLHPDVRRTYWRLGVAGEWEQIELLRRAEMVALFGPGVIAERLGPLVKSWIAVRCSC